MGQAGQVRRPGVARLEGRQHGAVQRDPAMRRDRLLDREARQLVPEGHAPPPLDQYPRTQALLERVDMVAGRCGHQPRLDGPGHHRDGLEEPARRTRQADRACEDRVADRGRDLRASRRQHLGDVERVAAGAPVQLLAVDAVSLGEPRDGAR
jgi:hypothetical protein